MLVIRPTPNRVPIKKAPPTGSAPSAVLFCYFICYSKTIPTPARNSSALPTALNPPNGAASNAGYQALKSGRRSAVPHPYPPGVRMTRPAACKTLSCRGSGKHSQTRSPRVSSKWARSCSCRGPTWGRPGLTMAAPISRSPARSTPSQTGRPALQSPAGYARVRR